MAVPTAKAFGRTLRGVVRERLADIERQMELGYGQRAIVEALAADGFPVTLDVFRNALYHARRRARRTQPATATTASSPAAPTVATLATITSKSVASGRQRPSVGSRPPETARNLLEQFHELARRPRPGEPDKLLGSPPETAGRDKPT